jgi:integrase/recombinase XerD
MTRIMQQMREELVRRNYTESTMRSYLGTVEDFRRYFQKRLDHMEPADIRRYQVHLLEERKLGVGTVINHVAALRFLHVKTLKRREMKQDLPYPKHERRLPAVLSVEEVTRLIGSARNLFHYTMLLTMYSAGLRRLELCRLKVSNVDSKRMMIRIERSKGGVDRDVPLSQKLLGALREYYRWMRPKTYLFPGTVKNWRADKPITPKVIWEAVQGRARTCRYRKTCYATHSAPLLCHASTRVRRGSPHHPSAAGPQRHRDDDHLPARIRKTSAGGSESFRQDRSHTAGTTEAFAKTS